MNIDETIIENEDAYVKIPLFNKNKEIVDYTIIDVEDFEKVNKF